uniref:Uncharacterized protein n=1 Tax=Arundo donax TaxID=35708 RepID=A0A0A9CKL3_ARUDO
MGPSNCLLFILWIWVRVIYYNSVCTLKIQTSASSTNT